MALQDPQDPTAGLGMPAPWEWPAEFQVDPADYGVMPLQFGGTAGVIESAAAPALAAPPPVDPADPAVVAALNPLAAIDHGVAKVAGPDAAAPMTPEPDPLAGWSGQFAPAKSIDAGVAKVNPDAADARGAAFAEDRPDDYAAMLARDPARLQKDELNLELERADRDREMLEQARANDRELADQNARMQVEAAQKAQAETARINAEAIALANTKIVRDRRSGGRRVLDVIMAAVGGLVAGRTGGPNVGLNLVLKRIDDDVEDQKAELQQKTGMLGMRRNIISDELARSGDMYKAQELARLAAHDAAIADIKSESMKFKPGGTRAIQLAKLEIGLQQSRAVALQALQDRNLKDAGERAKVEHQLLVNAQLRGKLSGVGGGAQPVFTESQLASTTPPPGWTKGTGAWLDVHNKFLTGKKTEQEVLSKANPSGMSDQQLDREVILPDGQKFIARGGTEDIGKLRKQVAATKTLARLMDEAIRIRTGWTSDTAKSNEWRELQANWASAIGVAKDVLGLGALSGPDMGLVEKFIGTSDPTEFRDPEAGILKARENIINITNDVVTSAGGPKFSIKYIKPEAPKPTDRDREFLAAQKAPTLTDVIAETNRSGKKSTDLSSKEMKGQFVQPGDEPDLANVVMPDIRAYIERAGASLKSKNPDEVKDARGALEKLLTTGGNAGIKQAALRQLSVLPEYQNPVARGGQ